MSHWLILGGTRFVGHHICAAALAAGHRLTLFHRGSTPAELPAPVQEVLGDRDGGLAPLRGRRWDAVIDVCGYLPRVVGQSVDLLRAAAPRYTFISSVSVYPDRPLSQPLLREQDALRPWIGPASEQITASSYGPLKVLCEEQVGRHPGGLIIRPGYVVGPRDPTARFSWWVRRLAAGGRVLLPDSLDLPFQVVDARDLAAFVVRATEEGLSGAFNVAGPAHVLTWGGLTQAVQRAVGRPVVPVRVDEGWLLARLEDPDELLPMWLPRGRRAESLMVDSSAARARGFAPRPVEQTIADILAAPEPQGAPWGSRLSPRQEEDLLRRWEASPRSL